MYPQIFDHNDDWNEATILFFDIDRFCQFIFLRLKGSMNPFIKKTQFALESIIIVKMAQIINKTEDPSVQLPAMSKFDFLIIIGQVIAFFLGDVGQQHPL